MNCYFPTDQQALPFRAIIFLLVMGLGLCGCGREEVYPARPIELICPWPAGGGTDRVARQLAHQLEKELQTPVNVINATGGNGVTGHTRGAIAEPHGYTLSLITVELNMLHWRGLTSLGPGDFEPLCLINRDDAAVFVRADSPFQTINELEEAIRNAAAPFKVAGTSQGGVWHVAVVGWLNSRDISPDKALWISIAGAMPSLQELLAGGVDFVCCSVPEAASLLDAEKIRCLGVMSTETAHQVPTFREAGINWSMGGWRGVAVPKGISPERKAILTQALHNIVHSEEFRQFMDQAGFDRSYAESAEFTALLQQWDEEFGAILTSDSFKTARRSKFGPMFFPLLIGTGLIVVSGSLLVTGELKKPAEIPALTAGAFWQLAIVPLWVIVYALLAPTAGFIVTTGLLLLISMKVLGVSWGPAVLITGVVVPAVYHLFAVILHVSLPWGWIGW